MNYLSNAGLLAREKKSPGCLCMNCGGSLISPILQNTGAIDHGFNCLQMRNPITRPVRLVHVKEDSLRGEARDQGPTYPNNVVTINDEATRNRSANESASTDDKYLHLSLIDKRQVGSSGGVLRGFIKLFEKGQQALV